MVIHNLPSKAFPNQSRMLGLTCQEISTPRMNLYHPWKSILLNKKVQQKNIYIKKFSKKIYIIYIEYELEKANKSFYWNEKIPPLFLIYTDPLCAGRASYGYLNISSLYLLPTVLGGGEDTVLHAQVRGFSHC